MLILLDRDATGEIAVRLDDEAVELGREPVADVPAFVRGHVDDPAVRWVFGDTAHWYPRMLAAGVRLDRSLDLRLCHRILRLSSFAADSALATAARSRWDEAPIDVVVADDTALFALEDSREATVDDAVGELQRQWAAIAASPERAQLWRLLTVESAGALIAAELNFAGLPWDRAAHEQILREHLGERPRFDGERPAAMQQLVERLRGHLDAPSLNPDSQAELLKALKRAGLPARSTSKWELQEVRHPVVAPLLEYKKMARLLTANGWAWLDRWVAEGRYRPDYVPGGVVTGRWASSGGGALQLPKQVRAAVIADPGWKLVVADAAQLEPRILAALSHDTGMARAGAQGDMYAGIVASGAVDTRDHAKVAMLGAMYGATTGESARLMPRLKRAYPRAIAFVEDAARTGERGGSVTTRLGRSSPPLGQGDEDAQPIGEGVPVSERERARAKAWGRFTRNFVVQGTAAEWALCWMALVRSGLRAVDDGWLTAQPHLVYFLHDEIVVHSPQEHTAAVEAIVRDAAARAGELVFGSVPVVFPVTVAVVGDYGSAK